MTERTFIRILRFVCLALIAFVLVITILAFVFHIETVFDKTGIRFVNLNNYAGVVSPSGKYRYVPMEGRQRIDFLCYLIYEYDDEFGRWKDDPQLLREFYMDRRYFKGDGWLKGIDVFYIVSSDVGHVFFHMVDGKWEEPKNRDDYDKYLSLMG